MSFGCMTTFAGSTYSKGDVNRDKDISAADASAILRYVVRLEVFDAEQIELGDVTYDGDTNSSDAAVILRYVVKLIASLDKPDTTPTATPTATPTLKPTPTPTATPTASPTPTPTPKPGLEVFYTGTYYNSIGTFEQMMQMSSSSLKSALTTKVSSMSTASVGYNGLKSTLPYSDTDSAHPGKMRLFYSQEWITQTEKLSSSGWSGWNREHCWPDSLGGSKCEGDINVMRPTYPQSNGHRSNYGYGEFTSGQSYSTSTSPAGTVCGYYSGSYNKFEPNDNVKGDVARIVFYVLINSKYSTLTFSNIHACSSNAQAYEMFLRWNAMDDPDSVEIHRNNYAQQVHGNRNPFIDCPALADVIWGA